MDGVAFAYRLVSSGWALARVEIEGGAVELRASYLGDALGDLLAALVLLLGEPGEVRFSWAEEPGEQRWILDRDGARVRVRILWFEADEHDVDPPLPDAAGTVLLDGACAFAALGAAVAAGARAVLDEHGEAGYRARWVDHDFPVALLRTLEAGVGTSG